MGLLVAAAIAGVGSTPAMGTCELHLFGISLGRGPERTGTMLVKALPGSDDPLAFINVLSPQTHMSAVSDEEYRADFHLADGVPVTPHWDVAVDRGMRKLKVPLIATPGRCHAELVGDESMGFDSTRSPTGKNEVRISFLFREFSPDGAITFEYSGGMPGAVATEKKVGREAALASLKAASESIIKGFADKVETKRAKKH